MCSPRAKRGITQNILTYSFYRYWNNFEGLLISYGTLDSPQCKFYIINTKKIYCIVSYLHGVLRYLSWIAILTTLRNKTHATCTGPKTQPIDHISQPHTTYWTINPFISRPLSESPNCAQNCYTFYIVPNNFRNHKA